MSIFSLIFMIIAILGAILSIAAAITAGR